MTDPNELVRHYNPTTRIIEHVTLAYGAANGLVRFDGAEDEVEIDKTIITGVYPSGALVAILAPKAKPASAKKTQHAVMSSDPVPLVVADEELHGDSRR